MLLRTEVSLCGGITVTTGDESKEYEIDVTVSNLWEAPTNLPPFDLNFTQRLEVFENQSAGTSIGTFSANDPEDDVLKYRLSSQGSEHNNPYLYSKIMVFGE